MTRISIIGCGPETGPLWDGKGVSLGVNDCEKHGKKVDYLLLLNSVGKFSPERLAIIEATRPITCYSHLPKWGEVFSNFKHIQTTLWGGTEIKPGVIYHSKTSPFCALSLALVMGFQEAVLWGVDFGTHKTFSPGKPQFEFEAIRYNLFAKMLLEKHGFRTYLGAPGKLNIPVL